MGSLWLPNFERLVYKGREGQSFNDSAGKKLLLHSTEGSNVRGALSAYKRYPPHIIVDFKTGQKLQHIPLNRSSYSLKGSNSEKQNVVQVEIVGFSREARQWPQEMLQWLVDEVFAPIHQMWPYALQGPPQGFWDQDERGGLASSTSPIRFDNASFAAFSGICAHQHAPAPDAHWDVPIDIDTVLRLLKAKLMPLETKVADLQQFNIRLMYQILLNRAPEAAGLAYWTRVVQGGASLEDVYAFIASSEEAQT